MPSRLPDLKQWTCSRLDSILAKMHVSTPYNWVNWQQWPEGDCSLGDESQHTQQCSDRIPWGSNWVDDVLVQKAIGLSLKSLKSNPRK